MKISARNNALALSFAAALALSACGGGGNGTASKSPPVVSKPQPAPTTYEKAVAAIAAAETAADAQAAYDAVKDGVTATQGEELQAAVDERQDVLAAMARRAAQKDALTMAAGAVDTSDLATPEDIAAAQVAISALRMKLAEAADVSDADKAMYQSQLDTAEMAVATAQGALDTAGRMETQRSALMAASDTLQDALSALPGTPTQEQIDAAQTAIDALNAAIENGADLAEADKASYRIAVATAEGRIEGAEAALVAANEAERKAEEMAEAEQQKAMAALAAKLHAGIGGKPIGGTGNAARTAKYGTDGIIEVRIGTTTTGYLMEDTKTTVAANHGWAGKRYTRTTPANGGTYEAVVYSNVGMPTEGKKFSAKYTYDATTIGGAATELNIKTGDTGVAGRVASSSFDQSAGKKEFELDSDTASRIKLSGSYHGVSGYYYCAPKDKEDCSATVATKGFTLEGGKWTFKATSDTRLMNVPDALYASYGWWLHKSAGEFTASAFAADMGNVPDASGIVDLKGTATYRGGAAGKYALSSATGGTNDAGHFTAKATLEADFGDVTIAGTVDNFTGADGEARNWSVELKQTSIGNTGSIPDTDAAKPMTAWTIDGTAAAAAGEWFGALKDNGTDDDVPKVATGTFHSTYGNAGRMVGAFGATKQ